MSAKTPSPAATLPQPNGYMRQHELLTLVPFSAATLWRRVKDGSFVAPVRLSPRVTAWSRAAVREWLDHRETVRASKR